MRIVERYFDEYIDTFSHIFCGRTTLSIFCTDSKKLDDKTKMLMWNVLYTELETFLLVLV